MSGDHNQYQKATGCEMNTDLIRRLEKQCWNYQANCLDAEKFAQLIVQECVKQVKAQYEPVFIDTAMMTDTHWAGYVQCGVDSVAGIREYFSELTNGTI